MIMNLTDFCDVAKKLSNSEKRLSPDEVGCYNCTRWRTGSLRCNSCYGFSEFKNSEKVNEELRENGLDYLCI